MATPDLEGLDALGEILPVYCPKSLTNTPFIGSRGANEARAHPFADGAAPQHLSGPHTAALKLGAKGSSTCCEPTTITPAVESAAPKEGNHGQRRSSAAASRRTLVEALAGRGVITAAFVDLFDGHNSWYRDYKGRTLGKEAAHCPAALLPEPPRLRHGELRAAPSA